MAIGSLIAGICFLFLPNYQLFDPLPDFIGYLLLLRGLSKVLITTPAMQEAERSFKKLVYLTLFRFISVFLFLILFRSFESKQSDGYLALFTLIFCGFETFYALSAFSNFFSGMRYLQLRQGAAFSEKRLGDLKTLTIAFFTVKAILNVLPTLHGLFSSDYTGNVDQNYRGIEQYTGLFHLTNLIFTTALGIFWLVLLVQFLLEVRKDTALKEAIDAQYQANLSANPHLLFCRDLRTASLFLCVAVFFTLDLSIDGIHILPDLFTAVFLALACRLLCRQRLLPRYTVYVAFSASILALASEIVSDYFANQFSDAVATYGLTYHPVYLFTYLGSVLLQVLWQGVILFLFFCVIRSFCKLIVEHTGIGGKELSERDRAENQRLHKRSLRKIRNLCICVCIYSLSCIVASVLVPFWESYWLLHICFGIVIAFRMINMIMTVYDQIAYRYL